MIDPLLVRVWPYSNEMFEALANTHPTERHAFLRIDPKKILDGGCIAIDAYMPQDEHYRKGQRAAYAISRLFEAGVPFGAEVRGMKEAHTVAEYQLWTMSDWIRGSVGSQRAGRHFFSKSQEEYVEVQHEITNRSDDVENEFGDLLFCISAIASNIHIELDSRLNEELNRALPGYAQRTSKKPLRFSQIDAFVRRYPDLPLRYALTDDRMKDFFEKIPLSYIVPEDGVRQQSVIMQQRFYRIMLSEAQGKLSRAQLIIEDDEDDSQLIEQANQDIVRAFTLTLLTSSHLLQSLDMTLVRAMNTNMKKIQQRIDEGRAVTRVH